jgi:L-alanine-DL-glutamate epimerase-like enolase superfamily enzyme
MQIVDYRITRIQFARDRKIGDSQVGTAEVQIVALELIGPSKVIGLGFAQALFHSLPAEAEIDRIFREEVWPSLVGQEAGALVHRVLRTRGGNTRRMSLPFDEAIQQACWDLFAKSMGLPLWRLLGGSGAPVPVYASGLDFHLSDAEFTALFGKAAALGFSAFKIKVGHPHLDRDIHRLDLLRRTVGAGATVMIDANEAWSARQTIYSLERIRKAGHDIFWVEDPTLRDDFAGLKLIRHSIGPTFLNSGEYLDVQGKRKLLESEATDMLNVHGQVTDVMRIGWLAAEMGIPVTLGNTFLEVGVNMAIALPEVGWLEYSFQNFEHLVVQPFTLRDGKIWGSNAPGHGLELSETARAAHHCPHIMAAADLPAAPPQIHLGTPPPQL